jgi:integrase
MMDDCLVEWRNDNVWAAPPSKSTYAACIAAIEKVYPRYKGDLPMARAALSGWRVLVKASHTKPMSRPWALLLGTWLSRNRLGRLGALLILQYFQCCRPSEILGLSSDDIVTAGEAAMMGLGNERAPPAGLLLLGPQVGTKSGRPQSSRVTHPILLLILDYFRATTPPGHLLTSHKSLGSYAKFIQLAAEAFRLGEIGWTPHSPRAGYASDAAITGKAFLETREHGRWTADKSLRGYLDVMAVMGGELALALRPFAGVIANIEQDFEQLFLFW